MAVLVAYGTRTKPQAWGGNGCRSHGLLCFIFFSLARFWKRTYTVSFGLQQNVVAELYSASKKLCFQ